MPRKPSAAPENKEPAIDVVAIQKDFSAANELALIERQVAESAHAVAQQVGYDGTLTVGALEDEIRFYQRRTVEACLELGKRLLVLKELTPHGEFVARLDLLGFTKQTAGRFMQAAVKTAKSTNLVLLSTQVKSMSAFLELVTHDDDTLEDLSKLTDLDRMSASQLRKKVDELQKEAGRYKNVAEEVSKELIDLKAGRIQKLPPDEVLKAVMAEATTHALDALGAIRGGVRQALVALEGLADDPSKEVFMAGLVGQLQAELAALREEFNLPDVSNAADAALAAEVAQWAGPAAAPAH